MAKAFKQVWKSITGMPTAQLTRYRLVKFAASPVDTDAPGISHTGAGENSVGVTEEPNTVGQPTQVVASGFSFCECGAAVTPGVAVMSDANGRMIPYVDGATNFKSGTCVVGGAAAGDIGTIYLG